MTDSCLQWLERLSYATEGILYEDENIQIGVKAEYHASLGRIALFLGNKLSTPLSNLIATIEPPQPTQLSAKFHDAPLTEIAARAQVQELIHVECKEVFTELPVLRMTFMVDTSKKTLVLRLPVFLSRFIEGVTLEQGPFFERWKIIGGTLSGALSLNEVLMFWDRAGPPREAQLIFPIKLTNNGDVDIAKNSKVIAGNRFSVLGGIDPNPSNVITINAIMRTSLIFPACHGWSIAHVISGESVSLLRDR
jgi:AP-2 complex subunit alpha